MLTRLGRDSVVFPSGRGRRLDDDFGVSIAQVRECCEPQSMSTEQIISRHVSQLKTRSRRGDMDSENTYSCSTALSLA